jgi:hypothetical protein
MGTRSTIALEFADGTVEQVYCHWDGYLSGVGAELVSDYSDPFALRELIDGGDMSSIGSPYTDRGEELCVRKFKDFEDYKANGQDEEYDYILRYIDGKGVWLVRCYATYGKFVSFETAREMEELETEGWDD